MQNFIALLIGLAILSNTFAQPQRDVSNSQIRNEGESIFGADIDLSHLISNDCKESSQKSLQKNCKAHKEHALQLEKRAVIFNSDDRKVAIFGRINIISLKMINQLSPNLTEDSVSPEFSAETPSWKNLPRRKEDASTRNELAGAIISNSLSNQSTDPFSGTSGKLEESQIEIQRQAFKNERAQNLALANAAMKASLAFAAKAAALSADLNIASRQTEGRNISANPGAAQITQQARDASSNLTPTNNRTYGLDQVSCLQISPSGRKNKYSSPVIWQNKCNLDLNISWCEEGDRDCPQKSSHAWILKAGEKYAAYSTMHRFDDGFDPADQKIILRLQACQLLTPNGEPVYLDIDNWHCYAKYNQK